MALANVVDLIVRNARLTGDPGLFDIQIEEGKISAVREGFESLPTPHAVKTYDAEGRLVLPGFVDTHIHLDKSCLLDCCKGVSNLRGAIDAVSRQKQMFTQEDVYARGARTIEMAIMQGTMHMRTHVEVDPRAGLRSFEAMKQLKRDYAFALDLSICVFPQEGLTNDPGAEQLLRQALEDGADLLGGCPYTDTDALKQLDTLFAMAKDYDVDLDFHLDFDLDASSSLMEAVCLRTERQGWQGRVTIGHATKLAAMTSSDFNRYANRLAEAGVAVTALPSTDLYLNGREHGYRAVRGVTPLHLLAEAGVTTSIATNNVLNPFTPFGDCSLLRMANLYANLMQIGPDDFDDCLSLITTSPARIMGVKAYGIEPGCTADLIVLDATDKSEAFGSVAPVVAGFKNGRQSFGKTATLLLPSE